MKLQTNTRKFYSNKARKSLVSNLHPLRIKREYEYQDKGKTVYAVEYYRDTKRNRREIGFPPANFIFLQDNSKKDPSLKGPWD